MAGTLYIVPVPIGNLGDITQRALSILSKVDIIACEDTRTTRQLLKHLNIQPRQCISYHEHNEKQRAPLLIQRLLQNLDVALVSDAGTPILSDPGYVLVTQAIEHNISVVPLPGPTAFVPALIASGLPPIPFVFVGFPPHKKRRKKFLQHMLSFPATVVCYESPHRLLKLLAELEHLGAGNRRACIARELTKYHEEFLRGSVRELHLLLQQRSTIKGEVVVVLEGASKTATGEAGAP